MSKSIDDIIGGNRVQSVTPYADSQPDRIPISNQKLTRMPPLVTPEGINPEFQKFFDEIVNAISTQKYYLLYPIMEHTMSNDDLNQAIENSWDSHWFEFYNSDVNSRGLDIELNMDRFKDLHRNLIGGFNIMTYHLNVKRDEFSPVGKDINISELVKASTELLFTYKPDKGFRIISRIQPFTKESI